MPTITIPKDITKEKDEAVILREEYEKFLEYQIPEFTPTTAEKKDVARARRNRARGNYFTIDELKRKLGFRG